MRWPLPNSKSRLILTLNETSEHNMVPFLAIRRDGYTPSLSFEAFSMSLCSLNNFGFIKDFRLSLSIALLGSSSFRKKEGCLTRGRSKSCYSLSILRLPLAAFNFNFTKKIFLSRIIFSFTYIILPVLDLMNKKIPPCSQLVSHMAEHFLIQQIILWGWTLATVISFSW